MKIKLSPYLLNSLVEIDYSTFKNEILHIMIIKEYIHEQQIKKIRNRQWN